MEKRLILSVCDWICCRVADFIIRIIALVVGPFLKKSNKKVVFIYANDLLGDTMIKVPFFLSLRHEFPAEKYHIVLVLGGDISLMISRLNCADEIIEEKPLHWRHSIFWIFTSCGLLAKSLRWAMRHKVEVFIACHRSRSLGLDFAVRLCKPTISVAYAVDVETPMLPMSAKYQVMVYDRLYTHLLNSKRGRHQITDMDMLISMAVGRIVKSPVLTHKDAHAMLDFTVSSGLPKDYVVLVPGARVQYRRWPISRFIDTARRLGGSIVVVGTREESSSAAALKNELGSNVIDLCGKTSLSQLGGVLLNAKLVVTNETGTANYATIIGAKTVCVLGGGDFGAFFPNNYCVNSISVYKERTCFDCGWKCTEGGFSEDRTAPCIDDIAVQDVVEAIRKII